MIKKFGLSKNCSAPYKIAFTTLGEHILFGGNLTNFMQSRAPSLMLLLSELLNRRN